MKKGQINERKKFNNEEYLAVILIPYRWDQPSGRSIKTGKQHSFQLRNLTHADTAEAKNIIISALEHYVEIFPNLFNRGKNANNQ